MKISDFYLKGANDPQRNQQSRRYQVNIIKSRDNNNKTEKWYKNKKLYFIILYIEVRIYSSL